MVDSVENEGLLLDMMQLSTKKKLVATFQMTTESDHNMQPVKGGLKESDGGNSPHRV